MLLMVTASRALGTWWKGSVCPSVPRWMASSMISIHIRLWSRKVIWELYFQSHATFRIDDNFTEKLKFQSFQKILPVSEQNHPQRIIRRSRKPFNHKNNKIGKLLKSFLFRAYALRDLVGKSSWRRRISFQ